MEKQVSNRQIFFITFVILTGFTVIELPKTMANSAGTGAWIDILIATIVFSLIISILISLNNMFKNKTLFEYSTLLVGKVLTYIFTSIYILYFFGVLVIALRYNAELIKLDLLVETPIWVTILVMVFFSTYAASKGLANIGRILEFFGTIIIGFFIIISLIMILGGDLLNVLPVFEKEEIGSYINALPLTIMPFLGLELLTMMPLTDKNKKAGWYGIGAIVSAGIIYIIIITATYAILGVEDTGTYTNALLVAIRRLEIDMFQFLKRLDIVALITWMFAVFCMITLDIYVVSEYTSKLFNKSSGKIVLICFGIIGFISALLPNNITTVNLIFNYLTTYFGLLPAFVIPTILFIVAKVKKNAE
jgi:spore germination protein (amino acid permease)